MHIVRRSRALSLKTARHPVAAPHRRTLDRIRTIHAGVARRMPRLWHFASEYLLLLPVGAAIALFWVNTAPESYFRTVQAMDFAVNDVAMVLVFGLVMKEVVEATAPGGVLHPLHRALMPLAAALGSTVTALALFVVLVRWFDEPRMLQGWTVVFAIDIAFSYFVARVIFGRSAAVPFVVLLGICSNGLGLLALTLTGTATGLRPAVGVPLMAAALTIAVMLRRLRVRSLWPYLAGGGGFSWCALYFGGLEPAFALLPILPFVPHSWRDPGFFVDAAPDMHDPLNRFERFARHPAQLTLLLFGFVAAGVPIRSLEWGTLSLPLSLALGKPAGLLAGVAVARALGLRPPNSIGWRELTVIGCIATIGFTIALFFANASFGQGPTLAAVKMGSLISALGVFLALSAALLLRTGRFARRPR